MGNRFKILNIKNILAVGGAVELINGALVLYTSSTCTRLFGPHELYQISGLALVAFGAALIGLSVIVAIADYIRHSAYGYFVGID